MGPGADPRHVRSWCVGLQEVTAVRPSLTRGFVRRLACPAQARAQAFGRHTAQIWIYDFDTLPRRRRLLTQRLCAGRCPVRFCSGRCARASNEAQDPWFQRTGLTRSSARHGRMCQGVGNYRLVQCQDFAPSPRRISIAAFKKIYEYRSSTVVFVTS